MLLSAWPFMHALGQGSIILLNGKTLDFTKADTLTGKVIYVERDSGRKKKKDLQDVFNIRYQGGEVLKIYRTDSTDNEASYEQMEMFIRGEQDAMQRYRPMLSPAGAFVTGMAGGIGGFYGLLLPAGYATITGVSRISDRRIGNMGIPEPYLHNEDYLEGFNHKAREKRIIRSSLFGVAGFIGGIFLYRHVSNK
jgi:hypothetical protein